MENWKRAVLAGSAGLCVILLLKGKHAAGLISGGVALATLASEYPEEFRRVRARLPYYIERGTILVDVASRLGERWAEIAENGRRPWYEALLKD
jgi:hypothetical protein